ncbi:MAG: hypothetical protein PVI43_06525 [Candidatus Bathyarchaeota archaeon]|jgi:hypothetical protein
MKKYIKLIILIVAIVTCFNLMAGMFYLQLWKPTGTNAITTIGGKSIVISTARFEKTSDATLTESESQGIVTNQGATGEVDLTLYALEKGAVCRFIVEEAQVIEINPPSGEAFDLDGTTLDADDCVDSDTNVGSKIVATRMKNASGTWIWSLDTARGAWVDTGASD